MLRTYRGFTRQSLHYFIRPASGLPTRPIASPAAWRGAELREQSDWLITLTRAEIAEIEAALHNLRQDDRPLHALSVADFAWPTVQRRIQQWTATLASGRGVQVVRGLPVQGWSERECERFFWGLGLHLGIPGAQNRDEELLGHVRDQGASYDDPRVRGYKTAAHLAYHCDAADVVGLFCLQTAKSGGQSRFVSSVAVWNELFARRPDLAERLFAPMELDSRGDGGLNFFPIVPCRYFAGQLRTFYHADYLRTAQQHRGARPLGARERELLDLYDEIASSPSFYLEMEFERGDIQLLNNHFVLHARSAYVDHEEAQRKRHLLRLWLSLPRRVSWLERPSMYREAARLLWSLASGRLRDRPRPGA